MRIKKRCFVFFICFFMIITMSQNVFAESKGVKWYSYNEGVDTGKKENKKIMVMFYTDW